jgi:hypothetical protein
MSWTPIRRPSTLKRRAAVTVMSRASSARVKAGLVLCLRPALLPECKILQAGGTVDVLAGDGDHAGLLRIQAGREFRLMMVGKKAGTTPVLLRGVPLPGGMEAVNRPQVDAEFDYGDDWVEITLPAWALPPAPPAPPEPRRSIMERVPDPAAPLRGARA